MQTMLFYSIDPDRAKSAGTDVQRQECVLDPSVRKCLHRRVVEV